MNTFILHNGKSIPSVGLGTWKSTEDDAYNAVLTALKVGYRHIDTAMIYGNEEAVGRAIKDSNVPREELFVTSKLWNSDQGYEKAKEAFDKTLEKLGLEYIDLYLIHWFKGYDQALETWRAMEEFYTEGRAKAIGVSNFNIHHVMYLIEHGTIVPMVNQVETHVELQNQLLLEFCQQHSIQLEAYAPFMSWRVNELLEKKELQEIAQKHNKAITQVVVRWLNQRGIVALPKSINPTRITANFDVYDFKLDDEDMVKIASLNKGAKMFPEFDNVTF
jgi:diketogulonate reductase-like aldo/keto reductase